MEMEETLRRMIAKMEALQREIESLKHRSATSGEVATPSHVEQVEAESQSIGRPLDDDEEKKKIHLHRSRCITDLKIPSNI